MTDDPEGSLSNEPHSARNEQPAVENPQPEQRTPRQAAGPEASALPDRVEAINARLTAIETSLQQAREETGLAQKQPRRKWRVDTIAAVISALSAIAAAYISHNQS